jgi:hypothetical protein
MRIRHWEAVSWTQEIEPVLERTQHAPVPWAIDWLGVISVAAAAATLIHRALKNESFFIPYSSFESPRGL